MNSASPNLESSAPSFPSCGFTLRVAMCALLALAVLGFIRVQTAMAVTEGERLTEFGSIGSAAGQVFYAAGMATDPNTGHVYISDGGGGNNRIDEFTAWGTFIKAFGWDVAPGAVNEEQEVTVRGSAGQFRLTFGAATTGDLPYNAPANAAEGLESVEAALNGLSSISGGGGSVGVAIGSRDTSSTRYVVTFSGGPLGGNDIQQLSAENGTTPLSGGTPASGVKVETRADGTPGGTGLESCTAASGCQKGAGGSGAGQMFANSGIAIAPNGDIYVREADQNYRVQKFDPAGRFILMSGGKVDKTTGANVCTAESGDTCGAGVDGTGEGEFSKTFSGGIAINAAGDVFSSDFERIQEFESNGTFKAEIPTPGLAARALSIDTQSGDIYVTFATPAQNLEIKENVYWLDANGSQLGTLPLKNPDFVATDPSGNVYAIDANDNSHHEQRVLEFNNQGSQIGELLREIEVDQTTNHVTLRALATNKIGDLYVAASGGSGEELGHPAFVRAYGPPPTAFEPPPSVAPTIESQFAVSVDPEDAMVRAQINPHFWADTTYYVEYGVGKCSEGGCDHKQPLLSGTTLTSKVVDEPVSASVLLEPLAPNTTYHYRFVSESGGGGPVRGSGGTTEHDGAEGTLKTFSFPTSDGASCLNQAFRTSRSAGLPDCRAYEMVSPVEKNNGDIVTRIDITGFDTYLEQSSLSGDALTYSSYRAFGDASNASYASQYIATRTANGWGTRSLAAPRGSAIYGIGQAADNEFKAFSPDLSNAWLVRGADPILAPGAVEGFPNLYRRDNSSGKYEALSTVVPPNLEASQYLPELQGYSADGSTAVIRLTHTPSGDASGPPRVYEVRDGEMKLACVLPNGTAFGGNCSAGYQTWPSEFTDRSARVHHALSEDGSRLYWTAMSSSPEVGGAGKIYLRLSGETTLPVSEAASSQPARFWDASADGSRALFTITAGSKAGTLYEYDLDEGTATSIAGKVSGVVAVGEDLSYSYFVSEEEIEEEGTPGKPNLYLHHEGANTFIATLSTTDVSKDVTPTDIAIEPLYHAARASANGKSLAFISTQELTGYDNADVNTGKPDSEVYVYDAGSGEVSCVSCNPSGARPAGRFVSAPGGFQLDTAASIPAATGLFYVPHAISDGGARLFFNSYDALVPEDTNGKEDVYEWEGAGVGSCEESSRFFSAANNGCVNLISSGESPSDSRMVDASPDGSDVFFATNASLLPQDPGLIDIYDARQGGGFSPQPSPPAACEGEACQGQLAQPNDPTPASSTFSGAGNVREGQASSRCAKGKSRHKGRCVSNRKPKHAKRANTNRRAER